MSPSLFDRAGPHTEPSALVAFAGNRLDRRSENRPDDSAARALETDGAKVYAIGRSHVVFRVNGSGFDPAFAPSELAGLAPDVANAVLLGYAADGTPQLVEAKFLLETNDSRLPAFALKVPYGLFECGHEFVP